MTPAAAMKGKSEGGKGAPESLASSRPAKRQRSGVITRRRGAAEWAAATEAAKVAATAAAPCTHSNVDSSQQQQDKTDSSDVPPLAQSNNNTINSNSKKQNQSRLASSRLQQKQQKRQLPAQEQAQQEDKEEDEVPVYRGGASPEPVEYRPSASPPPPAKRQRIARADIPAAVPRELLRVTDRLSGPHLPDTDEGHYVFTIGDNLTPRFKIMRKFGEGTFGRVMECWDRRRSGYVAIKVIRAVEKYRDAAMVELQVLATLAANDPDKKYPIVRLLEWFDYRGHVCMVFDRLGPSIYDCLRRNNYLSFPLTMARRFTFQVLEAVAYMHSFSLVHTDLKPENILFLNDETTHENRPIGSKLASRLPQNADVRLIDFGSATFNEDYHSSVVSTRHYRAPEIILGLGWSSPCDLWSMGCILVELLTGDALFQTHENLEHLAMMETVVGTMPRDIARAAVSDDASLSVCRMFKASGRLNWPDGAEGKRSLRAVSKMWPLREHLRVNTDGSVHPYLDLIVDLVKKLMTWNPKERLTAEEALKHPFFDPVRTQ